MADDAPVPAVPIEDSVHDDYIVCLDDGRRFKLLRAHLTSLGTTPDAYRAKWGLPPNYPMVAPVLARRLVMAAAKKTGMVFDDE